MKTAPHAFFNEASFRYIQQTVHVSRQEILTIIRNACVSADAIITCLRRQQSLQQFQRRRQ